MKPQLTMLTPVLDMLGKHIDVFPTSGGAVVDLVTPDVEETEDMFINKENRVVSEFGETPTPSLPSQLYRPMSPIYREEQQLYDFFIDGSRSVYYLGTGNEKNRSFPIALAQIGAGVIHRDEHGGIRVLDLQKRILLLLPKGPLGVSDTLWDELEAFNKHQQDLQIVDLAQNIPNDGKATSETLRSRAQGVASDRMHSLEIAAIHKTDTYRSYAHRLVLDGGVNWGGLQAHPYMIGVAKNFSKHPQFRFGNKAGTLDIIRVIARLPYEHRTVAFCNADRNVAFWYVRLRRQERMQDALQGVVKVEVPLLERKPLDRDEIDLISRTLIAERNVTPYGQDRRWHCHLYPVFQAEQAIKNSFYSQVVIQAMIRWPMRQERGLWSTID